MKQARRSPAGQPGRATQQDKPAEYEVKKVDYKRLVDVAINIGEVMLKHGAETYRVEDTMCRILSCAKLEYQEAYVTYTGIIVTLADPGIETITKVKRIENGGSNYNKIYLANNLSRRLCSGEITVEEAEQEIKKIRDSRLYSEWMLSVSMVLIAAMFAPLFGGGLTESIVAGVNGILIIGGKQVEKRLGLPGFISNLLISIAMAYLTRAVIVLGGLSGLDQGIVITSSIMPLVPGVAITNAIRDTLQGDYMSGGSRAIEAFVTAAAIAVGIGIGLMLFEMTGGVLA